MPVAGADRSGALQRSDVEQSLTRQHPDLSAEVVVAVVRRVARHVARSRPLGPGLWSEACQAADEPP